MTDGAGYLENRKITISQKPFGRLWRNFAWRHILILQRLLADQKIKLLKIKDGGRPPFWKLLNAISQQQFDRFWWNLVRRCIRPPSLMVYQKFNHFKIQDTAKHISRSDPIGDQKYDNLKIRKYKIVDRGHLKIKKRYLVCPILTTFFMVV